MFHRYQDKNKTSPTNVYKFVDLKSSNGGAMIKENYRVIWAGVWWLMHHCIKVKLIKSTTAPEVHVTNRPVNGILWFFKARKVLRIQYKNAILLCNTFFYFIFISKLMSWTWLASFLELES